MFLLMIFLIVFLPIIAGIPIYFVGLISKKIKYSTVLGVAIINFLSVVSLFETIKNRVLMYSVPHLLGIGVAFRINLVGYVFAFITSLLWLIVIIYSKDYVSRKPKSERFYAFLMITLGSTQGIFLSGDLLLLFLFFELMSFASYVLVIHDETPNVMQAGRLYLYMAIGGGLVLLMGLFMLFYEFGTLEIHALSRLVHSLSTTKYVIAALIISGFGVKAGMFPLHIWLPEAHPAAPSPASALLSGVLIKGGAFGIFVTALSIFKHDELLGLSIVIMGTITMLFGGLSAVFQTNAKRILAYSSISQMGFILTGIGLALYFGPHGIVAYTGTIYHILNHAFFKAGLFLAIGSVYFRTHELDIRKLSGFGKLLPLTFLLFIIAMAGISGIPGFNGFVSKTLLHEALIEANHHSPNMTVFSISEKIFTFTGGLTFCYLLKLLKGVFLGPLPGKEYIKEKSLPFMLIGLGLISSIIIGIGLFPKLFLVTYVKHFLLQMNLPGETLNFTPLNVFNLHAIKSAGISTGIGFVLFLLINKFKLMYLELPAWLSIKHLVYRPIGIGLMYIFKHGFGWLDKFIDKTYHFLSEVLMGISHKTSELEESYQIIENQSFQNQLSKRLEKVESQIASSAAKLGKKINTIIKETSVEIKNLNISIIILAIIIVVVILLSIQYTNILQFL